MATTDEIRRVLAALAIAYPVFDKNLKDDNVRKATIKLYERTLGDVDGRLLEAAALNHIAHCKWFPTIAELRESAFALATFGKPSAEEAWGKVQKAIRRFGSYRVPELDDPTIGRAVEIVGWRALCASENEIADRAHFFRIYDSLARRERDTAMMLPEVREMVLQLRGMDGNKAELALSDSRETGGDE